MTHPTVTPIAPGLWVARPRPGTVLIDPDTGLRVLYPSESRAWAALAEIGYLRPMHTRRAELCGS